MATWIQRRCPHCNAIRAAQIVEPGDLVPYGAEIVSDEQARQDRWGHPIGCPERIARQTPLPATAETA